MHPLTILTDALCHLVAALVTFAVLFVVMAYTFNIVQW